MLACIDVDYRDRDAIAVAGCVLFGDWRDAVPRDEKIARVAGVARYVPGQFYQRELPSILGVLQQVEAPLATILIDGYVWLDERQRPGLGGHLYRALHEQVPVIGVAKNRYRGATLALEVHRGRGKKPLYVTAAGVNARVAAARVQTMHGPFRIPTLIKRADRLCREHGSASGVAGDGQKA